MNNNEGFCFVSIEMFTDGSLVSTNIRDTSGCRGNFPSSSNYNKRKPVCFWVTVLYLHESG